MKEESKIPDGSKRGIWIYGPPNSKKTEMMVEKYLGGQAYFLNLQES